MEQGSADLFTKKSKAYAKHRAGYSKKAINIILSPFKNQEIVQIVDVGAGTGIGAQLLAQEGAKVIAIEPNQAMITAAQYHPNVDYWRANAEEIPLQNNSADVVSSFQAFHWFDFKKSLQEFNRILKPSGQLALLWNYWDITDPFTAAYVQLIDKATQKNKDRIEPYDGFSGMIKKVRVIILWKLKYLPYFKNVQRYTFKFVQPMDLDGLIGCAQSQSFIVDEGPFWDELLTKIISLHSKSESTNLVYNINLFTASPVK